MAEEPVDVLIIGAGASGAAMAWSLAETRMKIVCLEQGDWMDPAQYPSTKQNWELRALRRRSASRPTAAAATRTIPVNDSESPIAISNFNAVGGSTILYAAHFPRLHPSDFRVRSLDGVADDWPIDYATLEPVLPVNAPHDGRAGLAGDPAYPPKDVPLPPVPLGKLGHTLARGFNKLGWHWWPSDSAIATRDYEGRAACINLGPCITGCAQGAKASTDVTYWPAAIREGVELRTHCRVREITVDENGMASGVDLLRRRRQRAPPEGRDRVVACNGVGTPRLLLNSRRSSSPTASRTAAAWSARTSCSTPTRMVTGVFDEPLEGYKGPTGCCIWSQEFYETDPARGFVRGYSFEILRGMGPVSTALLGHVAGGFPGAPSTTEAYGEHLRPHRRHGDHLRGPARADNRVTLDPELTDSNGIPAPKITYRLSENSRACSTTPWRAAEEVLEAAGAKDTLRGKRRCRRPAGT